jgi:hypothetical protein
MAKVAPSPSAEADLLVARFSELEQRLNELDEQISTARRRLAMSAAGMPPATPEVRALEPEEQRVLGLRMEKTRLRDEQSRLLDFLEEPPAPAPPHAHLRHRRTPLAPARGLRARLFAGWSVVSTPVIIFAIGAVILPRVGTSATLAAVLWVVLLLSIEGLLRGQFLSVMLRMLSAAAVLVGLYFLVVDWRIVLGWTFVGAAALLMAVNLRDALRR